MLHQASNQPPPTENLEQTLVSQDAPPLLPPSLSNGDFSEVYFTISKNQLSSTQYQGGGFMWGAGAIAAWTAYVGSTVEVWDAGGEKFVELDGSPTDYGIKQPIANVKSGGYVLVWRQSGRNTTKAGSDPYLVRVYYMNGTTKVPIGQSPAFANFSKMQWADNAFGFQITPEQLVAAGNNPIYIAFIPAEGSRNTYGTLIDKVRLVPVEVREFETESGFDNFPRFDSSKTPIHPWVMVPRGDGDKNKFVVAGVGNIKLNLKGTFPEVHVTPAQTGQEDPLPVSVSGDLSGDNEGVELEDSKLVNLAYYPKVTVNVKFFEVTLIRADGTKLTPINGSYRTGIKLRDYLNKVFGKQCNVFFNISDEVTKIEVAYDVGDPDERFAEYSLYPRGEELLLRNPGNDSLDCILGDVDGRRSTTEEELLRAAGFDTDAVANIYFLPRDASMAHGPVSPNKQLVQDGGFAGAAFRDKKMILIPFTANLNEAQLQHVVAHEIGHMPLFANSKGLDHPRNAGNPDPKGFPMKSFEMDMMRLMATEKAYTFEKGDPIESRINPKTNAPYAYLIEEEWDAIRGIISQSNE